MYEALIAIKKFADNEHHNSHVVEVLAVVVNFTNQMRLYFK